jgi:hypothetical protein
MSSEKKEEMKKTAHPFALPLVLALAVVAAAAPTAPALAQQQPAEVAPAAPGPDPAEMQQYYAKLLQPGEQHQLLATMAGNWEMSIQMWGKPGMEPMKSTAKGQNEMILGGRFLRVASSGQMMGMKTESMTLMGFDGRSEKFTLVGFDTMGTYYVTAEGDYDAESKTFVLSGTSEHPKFGFSETYQFQLKLVSDDEHVMSLYFDQPDGSQFKMVEITYRRAK